MKLKRTDWIEAVMATKDEEVASAWRNGQGYICDRCLVAKLTIATPKGTSVYYHKRGREAVNGNT